MKTYQPAPQKLKGDWTDWNRDWRFKIHFQQFPIHRAAKDVLGRTVCSCGYKGD